MSKYVLWFQVSAGVCISGEMNETHNKMKEKKLIWTLVVSLLILYCWSSLNRVTLATIMVNASVWKCKWN